MDVQMFRERLKVGLLVMVCALGLLVASPRGNSGDSGTSEVPAISDHEDTFGNG